MAFVNALAWIAHAEDHHPDLALGYNRCMVRFNTHRSGLSDNDFICAAKWTPCWLEAALPNRRWRAGGRRTAATASSRHRQAGA